MKLHEKLNNLNKYPFHMPGHKRNESFGITGSEIDITEIDGFDNLHAPNGIILDTEQRLKSIYKAEKSFMLVNGSTVGILAAIFAFCNDGDKIIIAKNCHKSVYNACLLRHLKVIYLEPEFDYINSVYLNINQDTLDAVVSRHNDAKAVVITNPTYEGRISNVRCSLPLIVDAAHGAHLGFHYFPNYPKGDAVISSLHKTLPALTQCAVLNVYNNKYTQRIKRYLDIFETSSPSYVLMSSVSKCLDIIKDKELFRSYYDMLCYFRSIDLYALRLKYSDDISKIVISTENTDISGKQLADTLRNKYNIEPEMASLNYIILMTSVGDTQEGFDALRKALEEIDDTLIQCNEKINKKPPVPSGISTIYYPEKTVEYDLKYAIGKTCAEFVYAYPPDIPIISPGETITKEAIDYILFSIDKGINIISDSALLPNLILTKADE